MNITQSVISQRDRALLGGDYTNYHLSRTKKVHALRKRLGVTTPRGRKFTPKAAVTAEDVGKNTQWVQLLLTCAERAWADAMAMKTEQSPENTQKPMRGSTKRQIASRLRRAISYAENLVTVLSEPTSNATKVDLLEAKAYLALLRGGLDFERNKWPSCIQHYAFVRVVYAALGESSKTDIYKDILAATVDPSIRYAAYQDNLPRTKAVPDIAIEKFPSTENASRSEILAADSHAFESTAEKVSKQTDGAKDLPTTIEWRGRKVKLEDASISQALALAKEKEEAISETYAGFRKGSVDAKDLASVYEEIITARQDAADATKAAIDELLTEGVEQGDSRIQSLQITRTAINYGVVEWRIGRNRVLCGLRDGAVVEKQQSKIRQGKDLENKLRKEESSGRRLARLRECVALYDSIMQNLDVVKQLPGVIADTDFVSELDAKRAYFRALKCLAIGRSHAVEDRTKNALALFSRAQELTAKSETLKSTGSSSGTVKLDVFKSDVDSLQTQINSLVLQYRALSDLENIKRSEASKGKAYTPTLIQRLQFNQYDDNLDLSNVVNYPSKLQPVPMKPLFFDLAWNYISYPGHAADAKQTPSAPSTKNTISETKDEQPKKKGWFGFGR